MFPTQVGNQFLCQPYFPTSTQTPLTNYGRKIHDFIIEVEDPVPENFNPLPLRETLNQLLPTHCFRSMLEFAGAARHAHYIEPAINPSDLHITHRQAHTLSSNPSDEVIRHALRFNASGSQFFDAVKHAPLSFDKPPGIRLQSVKEESDASTLRSLKRFSL